MTTYTITEGRDAILSIFQVAWATTGYPEAQYAGSFGDAPNQSDPWARVQVVHVGGGAASLGNVAGVKRWRRVGVMTAQLFAKANQDGLTELDVLAKLIMTAYEKPADPGHGVWYRNVRLNEVGQSGDWTQFNIVADFSYDEVH